MYNNFFKQNIIVPSNINLVKNVLLEKAEKFILEYKIEYASHSVALMQFVHANL